jgi:hypothetical protein
LSGENLGEVQHPGFHVASPPHSAFDVEHAPEVTQHNGIDTTVGDVLTFVVGKSCRDFTELDRERAAKAAARLGLRHLGQRQPGHFGQQGTRRSLDAHFAQTGAAVMVGDRSGKASRYVSKFELIDEEFAELARFRGERRDALRHRRIVGKKIGDSGS